MIIVALFERMLRCCMNILIISYILHLYLQLICLSPTRTQGPILITGTLRIQNKISYAYELLRNGWAQRTISRALQEGHNFVPRHVSRKALNYMHTKYLKIDF